MLARDDPLGYRFRRITMGLSRPIGSISIHVAAYGAGQFVCAVAGRASERSAAGYAGGENAAAAATDSVDRTNYVSAFRLHFPAGFGLRPNPIRIRRAW